MDTEKYLLVVETRTCQSLPYYCACAEKQKESKKRVLVSILNDVFLRDRLCIFQLKSMKKV